MSDDNKLADRALTTFEVVVVRTLQVILSIIIAIAVIELLILLYEAIAHYFFARMFANRIITVPDLQKVVQRGFAAILLVILGLELLQTLRSYFVSHTVRLRIIFVVALIAVGRHIIQLELDHTHGILLMGIGVLVASLAGSFYLIVRIARAIEIEDSP